MSYLGKPLQTNFTKKRYVCTLYGGWGRWEHTHTLDCENIAQNVAQHIFCQHLRVTELNEVNELNLSGLFLYVIFIKLPKANNDPICEYASYPVTRMTR
jgi:hypothetical protein